MRSEGFIAIKDEINWSYDGGDPWGVVSGWSFALADVLWFDVGYPVADFRPSLFGPDTDSWEYLTLRDMYANHDVTGTDLVDMFELLTRCRSILVAMGKDY